MKHLRRTAPLLPALALLLSFAPARASLLRALVAEVPDGTSLVVVSGNRRLTVVLKGVAAPRDASEAGQARRHLESLALGREVMIDYTGLRGQNIHGRALRDGMDLGLQLVRDGAARYDDAIDNSLSRDERQLYAASERAAHSERRGVWKAVVKGQGAGSPAPGADVGALALSANVSVAPQSVRRSRPALSTEDVIIQRIASSPSAGKKRNGAPMAKQTAWPLNTPGAEFDYSQYLGQGRTTVVYFYADWCPACRSISPLMKSVNRTYDDMEVLALDIAEWGSPIAAVNGVNFVPYMQVYDKSGALVAEGKPATEWVGLELKRRIGLK